MAGLHPWAAAVQSFRAGGPVPTTLPGTGRLTPNQDAGAGVLGMETVRFAPTGHPLGNEAGAAAAARRLVDGLERERQVALWGGEGPSSYALLHCTARAVALTSVRGLRRRYPGLAPLEEAHRHLIGWWRAVATFALEWRGEKGVVRGVGDRAKASSADEPGGEDALGLDIVADFVDPLPAVELHPTLRLRLREQSLDHPHYALHRQHHRMLILELRELRDHLLPLLPPFAPRTLARLQEDVYWRRDPGIHLLMPVVVANPDSDGKLWWLDPVVRWIPGDGYREEPADLGPKGVSATWEEQEDADGNLVRNVVRHAIQGVPRGAHLPHPEGAVPLGGGWSHAGPETPPYPLPSLAEIDHGEAGTEPLEPPPGPDPEPEPDPELPPPATTLPARRYLHHARKRVGELLAYVERPGEQPTKGALRPKLRNAARNLSLLAQELRLAELPEDSE